MIVVTLTYLKPAEEADRHAQAIAAVVEREA